MKMALKFQKYWFHIPILKGFKTFIIGISLFAWASCEPTVPTAFTTASLEKVKLYRQSEKLLLEADTLNMRAYAKQIDQDLEWIETALMSSGDTLSKDTWLQLSDYRATRKALNALNGYYLDQVSELQLCDKKWEELTHDVTHDILSEENMISYVNDELTALRRVEANSQFFSEKLSSRLDQYRQQKQWVDSLTQTLQPK